MLRTARMPFELFLGLWCLVLLVSVVAIGTLEDKVLHRLDAMDDRIALRDCDRI